MMMYYGDSIKILKEKITLTVKMNKWFIYDTLFQISKQKLHTKQKHPSTVPYHKRFAPVIGEVCWNSVSQVGRSM